jgi:hypothetical protein
MHGAKVKIVYNSVSQSFLLADPLLASTNNHGSSYHCSFKYCVCVCVYVCVCVWCVCVCVCGVCVCV